MKIPYPMSAKYVRDWTPGRALCEFVSNGIDGETAGGKFETDYNRKTKTLILRNVGTTLPKTALVLGESEKPDGDEVIGQFGEGMKLACLVLLRERFVVKIRNGANENWTPSIEPHEQLERDVLVMSVTKASRQIDDFEIEVRGVSEELWDRVKGVYLHFRDKVEAVHLPSGTVITDPELVGQIYARGVFVARRENFYYGYDLKHLRIGRDREVDEEDLKSHLNRLLSEMVEDSRLSPKDVYDRAERGVPEMRALATTVNARVIDGIIAQFKERHGEDAIPVRTTTEATQAEHYGIKGVVVNDMLYEMLFWRLPSLDSMVKSSRFAIDRKLQPAELSPDEQRTFARACELLALAGCAIEKMSVVEFRSETLHGMFENGQVYVARKELVTLGTFLMTAVHEFGHLRGRDGEAAHVAAMDATTAKLFDLLDEGSRRLAAEGVWSAGARD